MVATVLANGLNLRLYVEWLLEQMPNAGALTDEVVDGFLPWSECVHAGTFEGHEQAALEIFEHIECSCNRARIHSAIGWMSPADYEARMSEKAAEAA